MVQAYLRNLRTVRLLIAPALVNSAHAIGLPSPRLEDLLCLMMMMMMMMMDLLEDLLLLLEVVDSLEDLLLLLLEVVDSLEDLPAGVF